MTVWRTWNKNKIKPHILRTFKLSNDKHFEEKLKDVVGLYMNPPGRFHDYITSYNTKPKPLIWTKTADQILDKVLNIKKSINTI